MNTGERLVLPAGDGDRLRGEAFSRVIGDLPLEGCTMERNEVSRGVDFVAPPGMAFRIEGELRVGKHKPTYSDVWPSRDAADAPLEEDPGTVSEFRSWDDVDIQEHIATRLTLSSGGMVYGRRPHKSEEPWTEFPSSFSSDSEIEIQVLDHPQAWTESYLIPHIWSSSDHPLARKHPTLICVPQNVIGMRQSYVRGDSKKVKVTLVEHDPLASTPSDGRARSPDGRTLQIAHAGSEGSSNRTLQVVEFGTGLTAEEYDDEHIKNGYYYTDFAELPREQRIRALWNGRRSIIGKKSHRDPFNDDPLKELDLVVRDPDTGRLTSIEEAIEWVYERDRLSSMMPSELDREIEASKKDPASLAKYADGYIEVIPAGSSMARVVLEYCSDDWRLATSNRRGSALFGQYELPHQTEKIGAQLAAMTLDEAVEEFASANWRTDDEENYRRTGTPRKPRNDDWN